MSISSPVMPEGDDVPLRQPPPPLLPVFISPLEAGHMLALSRSRIYELMDEGVLLSRYEGSRRLVLLASVQTYAYGLPA